MIPIGVHDSCTLWLLASCSGLKKWNLAIVLKPNREMVMRYVCCIPGRRTAIGPGLGFWKFHRTSHNFRASRARCYLLNFLLMYECRDFVLLRRSFICEGLKWQTDCCSPCADRVSYACCAASYVVSPWGVWSPRPASTRLLEDAADVKNAEALSTVSACIKVLFLQ